MKAMQLALAGALLAFASPAVGQQQPGQRPERQQPGKTTPGQQDQSAQRSYEATKAFAVVNAEMQNAKVNAKMLEQISADPRSYDRQHGEFFVKNIRESLNQAQTHLNRLRPMATSEEERQQFTEASTSIRNALQSVQPMQQALNDPKQVNQAASKLWEQIDQGMEPIRQMASSMDSRIEIGSTG
ncbi:MAG TPA: hypothetical protein VKY51_06985 [Fredinandcohnia sp.]|nr:hypothetical protein [Fredinandcohnia sp.]